MFSDLKMPNIKAKRPVFTGIFQLMESWLKRVNQAKQVDYYRPLIRRGFLGNIFLSRWHILDMRARGAPLGLPGSYSRCSIGLAHGY